MKKLLLKIWNKAYDGFVVVRDSLFIIKDKIYCMFHKSPQVASIQETIDYILANHCSISRFGDCEIKILKGREISYQYQDPTLVKKLKEILSTPIENHIVGLYDIFSDLSQYVVSDQNFWRLHLAYFRKYWYQDLNRNRKYYNTAMSRCYMMYKDKSRVADYFDGMKKMWDGRDVVFVEGERSRLGVGNDLFDNAKSIKRILGPQTNAFKSYDAIKEAAMSFDETHLFILALGPTATVLAYELAKSGRQAIDIGHVDIEYEWFKMEATHKVPVKNKYVHEASDGKIVGDDVPQKYLDEIVCRF